MRALVAQLALALARLDARAPVHTLRVAERHVAVLAHVAQRTLALAVGTAEAAVSAPLVTLGIWSWRNTVYSGSE